MLPCRQDLPQAVDKSLSKTNQRTSENASILFSYWFICLSRTQGPNHMS